MKVLKIIGIIILVIVIIGIVATVFGPTESHVERSVTIDAPVETVFKEVNGFRTFDQFSAWSEVDTTAKVIIEGPATGVGASYRWDSDNSDLGKGSIEIIESDENMMVKSKMKFEGYPGEPTASWILNEEDGKTVVTYTYDETNISGIGKLFAYGIDGMLGPMYERTLEKLKSRIESRPEFTYQIDQVETEAMPYIGSQVTSSSDPQMIGEVMGETYEKVFEYLNANNIEMQGAPISININYDEQSAEMICAVPVGEGASPGDDLVGGMTYEGAALKTVYLGNYDNIGDAHEDLNAYISYYGYDRNGQPWEEYITDPMSEPDTSKWMTNVYYPVK
ncbi:effector-binding domain-containing protein [Ekhidna lutea]|uniref:Effector-binding domain-containing protein n=1 Tax=Ekhidna lutea TaxID=447679 RepID=A0A239J1B1_EKHLU|nr:SRPBCC family protein [Ekhidna lutea]SNS99701.1 effector-binding domain-containing protein [Ekhidna lutea]